MVDRPNDGEGTSEGLVVPAFAEPHVHLDRAFSLHLTGANSSGLLSEAVERFLGSTDRMTVDALRPGAVRALSMLGEAGVGHVRAHTAVGGVLGFRAWEAVEAAAREVPEVEVRQVAMAIDDNLADPEVGSWLREAAARGAVAVGGAPWLAEDPSRATRAAAEIAAELDLELDLHVDETDDPSVSTVSDLCEAVSALGLQGRAVAAHCCSMALRPPEVAAREAAGLAEAGVAVVVCPVSNLALQGRATGSRGVAPVRILRAAGVAVGIGLDNLRDVVVSVGAADPLRAAWLLALAAHLTGEEDLRWLGERVIHGNRAICGLAPDGEGRLLLKASSLAEAVALVAPRRRLGIQTGTEAPLGHGQEVDP